MNIFARFCLSVFFLALLVGCKSKKPSLAGEDEVEVGDFIDFFPTVKLPYQFADTTLLKKDRDSLLISYAVFTQFIPDSVISTVFGKGVKPKIYPMAKVIAAETYLFAKAVSGNKRVAFVLGFDNDDKYLAAMPLLQPDTYQSTIQTAGIDRRSTIFRNVTRKNADGSTSDGSEQYALNNDAGSFMLIMTEALDEKVTELINPIDTLKRKQKFAADYSTGKMNLVSIRDGRKGDRLQFFIHIEKNNGECTGELKGEAIMKSATKAEYREAGESCSLVFNFTASSVTVKELGGCGSNRGLRCSFDGVYPRKKETKPKSSGKK
jgi:hypothetical protein